MVAPMAASPCESSSTFLVEKGKMASHSSPSSSSPALTFLAANDVALGELLGAGSFCTVHKARIVRREGATGSSSTAKEYALKRLSATSQIGPPIAGVNAINDLRNEAIILSTLPQHRNIIRLRALSNNFWKDSNGEEQECSSSSQSLTSEPFLVLELMVETLHDRLQRIRKHDTFKAQHNATVSALATRLQGLVLPLSHNESRRRLQQVQLSRLYSVGLPVCSGVAFLHRHNVAFRDLKPSNIGFDAKGRLKLLDFGFARVVPPKGSSDDDNDNGRRFTGPGTGTVRYMAPEVMRTTPSLDRACNNLFASDVYSLSVVLWELVTTHKPFASIHDVNADESRVIQKVVRPPLRPVESKTVRAILKAGWDASPDVRPSAERLRREIEAYVAAEAKTTSF